jgi:preprotein translocase subunit SecB
MEKTKQPGIKFDNVILKQLEFSRKPEIPAKSKLDMNFRAKVSVAPNGKMMTYELACQIEDIMKSFKIKCSLLGFFSVEEGQENMTLDEFAETNAPAMIFPFLREVIVSITTKAGMPPLLLPPINIYAMLKQEKIIKKENAP